MYSKESIWPNPKEISCELCYGIKNDGLFYRSGQKFASKKDVERIQKTYTTFK